MIKVDTNKITEALASTLIAGCPFNAIARNADGLLEIGAGCRMCKQCLKLDTAGALSMDQAETGRGAACAVRDWRGILVFAEFTNGKLHPVSLELLGKARELSGGRDNVYAVIPGYRTLKAAETLARYGANKVFVYDDAQLSNFEPMRFAACAEDCIKRERPAVVMIGATMAGRSLAPRLAARLNTGLTADCTALSMNENGELLQTRPAFGGDVMAEIITKHARPQMCTVRYRVFNAPTNMVDKPGELVELSPPALNIGAEILKISNKPAEKDLSEASAIIAVGRGCASKRNLEDAKELAALLGAQLGCTRPLTENGIFDAKKQIGLSGRAVQPKYIILLGISGSVQFVAGMSGTKNIIAINKDPGAPIFQIAHMGYCCDVNSALPAIIKQIKAERGAQA